MIAAVPAQQPTPSPGPTQDKRQQAEGDDVVRITTNLVQVDAVITDNDGKPVSDLKPDDVELFEDGRKQKITNLSYQVLDPPPTDERPAKPSGNDKNAAPVPPTRIRPENVRRTIAIVVDDLGLSFESVHFVREALKKFVDRQMQEGDLVAIVRTAGGMGALQQFTTDKRQLYAAIDRIRWHASGRGLIGAFAPIGAAMPGAEQGPSDPSFIPGEDAEQSREDVLTVGTLGSIGYVVRGLRELPGRKSVLLVSDGLNLLTAENLGRNQRTLEAMQRLTDLANRAAVVINTLDARGLQTLGFTAADNTAGLRPDQSARLFANRLRTFSASQDGMFYLAETTGGISIKNNNDLSGGIRRVLEDQKSYYLIAYRPDESTFDERGRRQFHKLTLKVTRPGKYKVRMRTGFYGFTDEERRPPSTPVQQLKDALVSPFGATGVHLQLTSLFANDPKQGSLVRSILYIDPRDLTFTEEPDGKRKCVFDLMAITFGDNGVPIDQVGRTYTIVLRDDEFKRVMREGLVYYATVPIKKPGAYQLRVSLRDSSTERVGSASQFIEAPDIKRKRLVLSGLIIRGENAATYTETATTRDEGREEGDVEASPAIRRLKPGMVVSYGYFIYNSRIDKASSRPQLTTQVRLFRDGKEVYSGKEIPFDTTGQGDLQRLAVGGAIQLGPAMEPGEYVLQVIVTDPLADKKHRIATQWMDFQIVK
ncbi:MAG TPA: VWA domain-containing protein [Pyrinomonadaceae bacterium]